MCSMNASTATSLKNRCRLNMNLLFTAAWPMRYMQLWDSNGWLSALNT